MRRKIADAAGCQIPYVSHVLSGNYHFSAEQAEGVTRLLGLTQTETEYFLNLVLYQRAGTARLKDFYEIILSRLSEQHSNLRDRLQTKHSLDRDARTTYYSSWHYSAVHMLATIPGFQTKDKMIERLKIPEIKCNEVIEFLLLNGLLEKKQNLLRARMVDLHLERSSSLIAKHHFNWRLKAMQSLDQEQTHEMHYSLTCTISHEDLPKLRQTLTEALEKCVAIIRPSKEEELISIGIDLFKV